MTDTVNGIIILLMVNACKILICYVTLNETISSVLHAIQ